MTGVSVIIGGAILFNRSVNETKPDDLTNKDKGLKSSARNQAGNQIRSGSGNGSPEYTADICPADKVKSDQPDFVHGETQKPKKKKSSRAVSKEVAVKGYQNFLDVMF